MILSIQQQIPRCHLDVLAETSWDRRRRWQQPGTHVKDSAKMMGWSWKVIIVLVCEFHLIKQIPTILVALYISASHKSMGHSGRICLLNNLTYILACVELDLLWKHLGFISLWCKPNLLWGFIPVIKSLSVVLPKTQSRKQWQSLWYFSQKNDTDWRSWSIVLLFWDTILSQSALHLLSLTYKM